MAHLRTEDPTISPFHLEIVVGSEGRLDVLQLADRRPCGRSANWTVVDARSLPISVAIDGTPPAPPVPDDEDVSRLTVLADDLLPGATVHLDLGASRLVLEPFDSSATTGFDPEDRATGEHRPGSANVAPDRVVIRRHRVVPKFDPMPIDLTAPESIGSKPGLAGLIPAAVALGGAGVIAVLLGQPMFFLFGAIGGLVAVVSWAVQRGGWWRSGREARRAQHAALIEFDRAMLVQRDEHRRFLDCSVGDLADCLDSTYRRWERRASHADAWVVSLGTGEVHWTPVLEGFPATDRASSGGWSSGPLGPAGCHEDAPIGATLGPGAHVAIRGETGISVVRSIVVQLAERVGSADWQLVIVTDSPDRWRWAERLPHLVGCGDRAAIIDEAGAMELCRDPGRLIGRHTVVVTDLVSAMSVRTSSLRRLGSSEVEPAMVVLCSAERSIPSTCTAMLDVGPTGRARWSADVTVGELPVRLRYVGIGERDAAAVVSGLAQLIDPEDAKHGIGRLPRSASLVALLGLDVATRADSPTASTDDALTDDAVSDAVVAADAVADLAGQIAQRWQGGGPDVAPRAPIGVAIDGAVELDLVRDGPHALLAGTTGSGKSELLRAMVIGLAVGSSPEQLNVLLIDYKGGATFDVCERLPHVVGVVTDLDDQLAERALRSLRAELRRRELVLRDHGAVDLTALRRAAGTPVMPRLIVVIDEFAALAQERASFLHALVDIAQRGRSLGIHLVLATQRPSGVISDDIRANTNLRLALRLQDVGDAQDVVGDGAPSLLPRDVPGRAILRLAPGELVEFQAAHTGVMANLGRGTIELSEAELLVAAVSEAALLTRCPVATRPWCDALPVTVELGDLRPGVAGITDLPDEQRRGELEWEPSTGHLLVVGATGSGVTSSLQTAVLAALLRAAASGAELPEVVVIDALGNPAWQALARHPQCAGVVTLGDRERLVRALHRVDVSNSEGDDPRCRSRMTILVIDGLGALRSELDGIDRIEDADLLARVLAGAGAAGAGAAERGGDPAGASHVCSLAIGNDDGAAIPGWLLTRFAHRWLLHLHDQRDAGIFGILPGAAPPPIPGRICLARRDGAVAAQVGAPRSVAEHLESLAAAWPNSPAPTSARRLGVLPARVDASSMPPGTLDTEGWVVPIGLAFDDLAPCSLDVPDGDHVLVLGPPRSGRSTVLERFIAESKACPEPPWCGVLTMRKSPLRSSMVDRQATSLDELLADVPRCAPALLVIDDAELVDDPSGKLGALLAARHSRLVVVAAGRAEGLRGIYGHWTSVLRRSRRGLILTGSQEADGDLLGAALPRRHMLAPRPGLGFLVHDGDVRLVQCAMAILP